MSAREATFGSDDALGVIDPAQLARSTNPAEFFESIYRDAAGDAARVPWADSRANPALVSWLNAEAAGRLRPGARAVVVGCGLGDDVMELANRGYDACGFDLSPTAVTWARRRFPDLADALFVADALSMPTRYRHRFDVVVEAYTLQSVDPALREPLAAAITNLACPRGLIIAIARGRDESELLEQVQGPPYPFTSAEFAGLFEAHGWRPTRAIDDFTDDEDPPKRRLRGAFAHA